MFAAQESRHRHHYYTESPSLPTSAQLSMLRNALFSTEEPLRISNLEVSDLKVDRLSVSQLEAYKIAASEIDAIVVSATEMSSRGDTDSALHPSILQELIAIRNHLETVAAAQSLSRPPSAMEDAFTETSNERIDLDGSPGSGNRRGFVKETSPFLEISPSPGREATDEQGRTIFPSSSSIPDLRITPDNESEVSRINCVHSKNKRLIHFSNYS